MRIAGALSNRPLRGGFQGTDSIIVEEVPPGSYQLVVLTFSQTGTNLNPVSKVKLPLNVPDDPPTGVLDLGMIDLNAITPVPAQR